MDSFTIVIIKEERLLELKIYSRDKLSYIIFCKGTFMGKIFLDFEGKAWGTIAAKDLTDDINYTFSCNKSADCTGLMFSKKLMSRIGEEITKNMNFSTID